MPIEVAVCRCGRRYQHFATQGEWDGTLNLAECPECADKTRPWYGLYPNLVESAGWSPL